MTELDPNNFFDNTGGGSGAPSARLKEVNDGVIGEIVDQFMVPATDFSTKEQKTDKKTGKPIEQLVVILQTDQRNWAGVTKVPLVDKDDKSSGEKPASEDDGKRAIYVEPWTNIHGAIGEAVVKGTGQKGPLRNGGRLGVKVVSFKDTGKGNPLKVHGAVYTPPAASSGFFEEPKTAGGSGDASAPAQSAPAQQEQTAPAAQDPWGAPAPSQPPF